MAVGLILCTMTKAAVCPVLFFCGVMVASWDTLNLKMSIIFPFSRHLLGMPPTSPLPFWSAEQFHNAAFRGACFRLFQSPFRCFSSDCDEFCCPERTPMITDPPYPYPKQLDRTAPLLLNFVQEVCFSILLFFLF